MTKYKVNLIHTANSQLLDSIFIKVITKELNKYLLFVSAKGETNNEK